MGQRREHLLAIDHPLVAVAPGTRLRGGDVGAGVGLAVAETDEDLAAVDPRHHLGPLGVGAHELERARHEHRRAGPVHRGAGARQLVDDHRVAALARAASPSPPTPDGSPSRAPCRSRAPARRPAREVLGQERPHLVATRVRRFLGHEAEVRDALALPPGVTGGERPRLGPAEEQLGVVLEHEAVAAVHVQRCGRRLLGGLGREHERHRHEQRVGRPRRFVGQQAGTVDRGGDVGEPVLHGLERADGHAELTALLHVGDADVERALRQADERRR